MLKYKILLIVFLLIISGANAQKLHSFGLKLGVVSANQSWNYVSQTDFTTNSKAGIGFGAMLEYLYKPGISFIIELDYLQKGFSSDVQISPQALQVDSGGGGGVVINQTKTIKPGANYLSLPVTAEFIYRSDMFSPYCFAGPRLDYLIGRNDDGAFYDNFHKWDFGVSIGAGLGIYTESKVSAFLEVRYDPSLVNAYSNDQVTVKNTAFEVFAGIRILTKK
jgi:opacity protein-like surface antigen